ncbi:UDP-4-amino-4,6-dideoxy-N-acetyl-beta-L-altrosamine transaminase [Gammaproteobacteria bacterium]|nr:UDP-4-amino-4,6-dideoxy-N-acetyl-beta-L-altrosamine transaminase [Gammaproteobacteria bacterium]
MIPYGRQSISQDDVNAVVDVLNSDFLTQGPTVPLFEDAVKDFVGSRFAIAANSATSALHLACLALGVAKGDIVWTSAITFVASANCAIYCGASVDFIDIDAQSYNMSVSDLEQKLILAKKSGKLPKVLIPVHLCGQSCDMQNIFELSKKYGFKIIEDASHSIGGKHHDSFIGSCRFSDITVFSFHPVKIITSAEGGMCTTNNSDLARTIELLRTHGITRDENELTNHSEGTWYYEQQLLGFNYRMTDLQAALGLSQLDRLNTFISSRNKIAELYIDDFSGSKITFQKLLDNNLSAYHLFVIQIEEKDTGLSKKKIFEALKKMGINVNLHYIPVYRHPYYQSLKSYEKKDFPNSEKYYSTAISIPIFPDLNEDDRQYVSKSILGMIL